MGTSIRRLLIEPEERGSNPVFNLKSNRSSFTINFTESNSYNPSFWSISKKRSKHHNSIEDQNRQCQEHAVQHMDWEADDAKVTKIPLENETFQPPEMQPSSRPTKTFATLNNINHTYGCK